MTEVIDIGRVNAELTKLGQLGCSAEELSRALQRSPVAERAGVNRLLARRLVNGRKQRGALAMYRLA